MTVTMLMANLVESWELGLANQAVGRGATSAVQLPQLRSRGLLGSQDAHSASEWTESERVALSEDYSINWRLHSDLELQRRDQEASNSVLRNR